MPIDPDVQTELDNINAAITVIQTDISNIQNTLENHEERIANNESLLNQFFFGIQNTLANNYIGFNETANT